MGEKMAKRVYGKTIWQLLEDFAAEHENQVFTRKEMVEWFRTKYPEIKTSSVQCHIISCAVNDPNRKHYSTKKDILYRLSDNRYKKYNILTDGEIDESTVVSSTTTEPEEYEEEADVSCQAKILEKHIEEFVISNLGVLKLELYNDEEGGRTGQQFDTYEIGRIDLLCHDSEKNLVILELKKGRPSDKVVGQLLRYIGWVRKNIAKPDQKVRGLIISEEEDSKLDYALMPVSDIITQKEIKIDLRFVEKK
jgi:hypothetical protein